MKRLFTTLIILFIFTSISLGQETNDTIEYKETLEKMIRVSGSEQTYQTAISQMLNMYKQQFTFISAEDWNELEQEFKKTSINDLVELLVPVYQKYLTINDLKELIKFHESPVGKKLAQISPLITQETMQIGQQWGMKIGQDFAKKMEDKGKFK